MPSHVTTYGVVKLDEHGCIARELTCIFCEYDLRGLKPTGNCPECGKGIHESLAIRPAPIAWHLSVFLASFSAIWTVLTYVCHHIYVSNHATFAGPIELYYRLANLCSFVVFLTCVAAFIHLRQSQILIPLVVFIVSLGLFFVSFCIAGVRV